MKTGVRQGCILSPLLFNCFMDRIVREAMEMTGGGLHVEYTTRGGLFLSYRDKTPLTTCIQNAQYADDLTLVAENRKELQQMIDALDRACTRWAMRINGDKTKVLSIGEPLGDHPAITLKGQALMLGATIWIGDLNSDPARHQETEDFPNEMPPGHCGCDSVGYAAQC